jgi:hypothetical protein
MVLIRDTPEVREAITNMIDDRYGGSSSPIESALNRVIDDALYCGNTTNKINICGYSINHCDDDDNDYNINQCVRIQINNKIERPNAERVIKVSGCAGAGKTTYICNKINDLLKSGVKPEEIFLISFSKASVKTLKERLWNIENIKTLHSIAYKYVKSKSNQKLLFNNRISIKDSKMNTFFIPNKLERNSKSFEVFSLT